MSILFNEIHPIFATTSDTRMGEIICEFQVA